MTVLLLFGERRPPTALRGLTTIELGAFGALGAASAEAIDEATATADRVIVVGSAADLAGVLTRLLRTERLDVEVAHLPSRSGAQRAATGAAHRVPLIRDETGTVLVGTALWLPADGARTIAGEAVVDDTVLFDGEVAGVQIEPLPTMPGVRATVLTPRWQPNRWVTGRAVQLGTTGAVVVRDGLPVPRPVRRSTFYRHTQGWLRVS